MLAASVGITGVVIGDSVCQRNHLKRWTVGGVYGLSNLLVREIDLFIIAEKGIYIYIIRVHLYICTNVIQNQNYIYKQSRLLCVFY